MKFKLLLPAFLFLQLTIFAQDASTTAVFKWNVTSRKIAEKKYELTFSSAGVPGTELYAPSQDLEGAASAELTFNDSSVSIESFTATGNTKKITSAIFNNKQFDVTVGKAAWNAVISFRDKVPGQLLGKLSVFFNRGADFLPDIPFSFSTVMEGGVASGLKIKLASLDIKNPVNNCGDEGTQSKSLIAIFYWACWED